MQALLKDKRHLFWMLQFAGWSGWAMSFYLGIIVWGKPPEHYYLYLPFIATVGMLLTLVLRALYRHMWEMEITRRIIAIAAGSYAAGLVWMAVRGTVFYNMYPEERKVTEEHSGSCWYGALSILASRTIWPLRSYESAV